MKLTTDPAKMTDKDWKLFWKFQETLQKQADKIFGKDDEGDSYVDVSLRNRRFTQTRSPIPVKHMHLLKNDAEWRDAVRNAMSNASSATNTLDILIQCYDSEKRHQEDNLAFAEEANSHCLRLGVKGGCVVIQPREPWAGHQISNLKWYALRPHEPGDYSSIYFSFQHLDRESRKKILDFITGQIAGLYAVFQSKPEKVMLSLSDGGSARVFGEFPLLEGGKGSLHVMGEK